MTGRGLQAAAGEPASVQMAGVVTTIRDKCKRCYSCIRNCPAKAIRVAGGQAEVIEERCIGCGNCFKVCAQKAKEIRSARPQVRQLLAGPDPVFACLAPSFPAAFPSVQPGQIVTALRRLGFSQVLEVAFGAELVARQYARLAHMHPGRTIITTPCPAVVTYVEKYAPSLVPHLAPIVSPMVALGRAVKSKYCPGARIVFIGPCVAKKNEMDELAPDDAVDEVLTYQGLQRMLDEDGIDIASLPPGEFDGPRPGTARIFPVSGGLLKTAMMRGDVLNNEILVTEGRDNVLALLDELAHESLEVKFADILFCEGCIDGPVIGAGAASTIFKRKELVSDYVRQHVSEQDRATIQALLDEYADIDLSREFTARPVHEPIPTEEEIRAILQEREQDHARGRAGLPCLRLPVLPRKGHCRVPGPGRGTDVPPVPHRPAPGKPPQAGKVQPGPGRRAAGAGSRRAAGQHGPAGGRRGPRDQQPPGNHSPLL